MANKKQPTTKIGDYEIVSEKNYVIAFVISWLVGFFGIDRFYLGYTWLGLLKLITFGGLGLWWFIDWVLITFGVLKDSDGRELQGYQENKKVVRTAFLILIAVSVLGSSLNVMVRP
jgi:hypothetical protein